MASLVLTGDTSGQVTIAAPAVAGTNTLTLQAATATNSVNTLATAVASTSGTSIDFTSLPSWIKKITVMFNGVSTNGASMVVVQLGTGGVPTTSGYQGAVWQTSTYTQITAGLGVNGNNGAADARIGSMTITNITGNTWISASLAFLNSATGGGGAGVIALGGTLNLVRITTVNGTDTFDAGTVNILYEG